MSLTRFGVIGNPRNIWLDGYLVVLLISSTVGFLSVRGCTNTTLFLLLIPALAELKASYRNAKQNDILGAMRPIVITLALPVLAILFGQTLRQEFIIKSYDGPSRILLSIVLLFYFTYKKIDVAKLVGFSAPLGLLLLVPVMHSHPEVLAHWSGRFATAAVDPTAFGTYTLILSAFCFFSIETDSSKLNYKLLALQATGLLAGLYLIIGSGTRGSWLAIPPLVLLWLTLKGRTIHPKILPILCSIFFVGLVMINFLHPEAIDRFYSGFRELSSWLDNTNRETSTGFRLTMWQISWELFKHNPFYGYGDAGLGAYLNESWITSIASPESRQIIQFNGPHNEFLANLLRSGCIGGISVLCLFLVPAYLFWQNRHDAKANQASQLGLAFITCLIFCSISSEVLNLKYTATFYGLTIAGLAAQIFQVQIERNQKAKDGL